MKIENYLIERTRFKYSSFGNDKAPKRLYSKNKHHKNIFFEFNRQLVYMWAREVTAFPKGADNYKESILH